MITLFKMITISLGDDNSIITVVICYQYQIIIRAEKGVSRGEIGVVWFGGGVGKGM